MFRSTASAGLHARRSRTWLTLAGLLFAAPLLQAQTATIYGSLANFDVVNNTGQDACGFEVEIEGVPAGHPIGSFDAQRYGAPTVVDYVTPAGVTGRRMTHRSPDCGLIKTAPHAPGTPFGGSCYSWNTATYAAAGCEHFGVRYSWPNSKVTYRWLVRTATAGVYTPLDPPVPIASPVYSVQPPAVANAAPVVVAVIPAPPPPPARFGEPTWMKTYVRQLARQVTLDELITENPLVVPMDAAQLETNWELMQSDPPGEGGRRNRGQSRKGSTLDPTTRTVVRRFETYAYTGPRDALTNEALCADLTCSAPSAGELGDFVSAQMAAVHVQGDFISVAKAGTGGGNVDSADKRISCGNKCVAPYTAGSVVTLSVKADSGSSFAGWSGACSGTAATCSVTINGANTATATFNKAATGGSSGGGNTGGGTTTTPTSSLLSVSLGNPGMVSSVPAGISCGATCSARFAAGSSVTLTATPLPGLAFTGWSGACSTTIGPVCTLTMGKDLSTKAGFSK
jgi:hypothetical protein